MNVKIVITMLFTVAFVAPCWANGRPPTVLAINYEDTVAKDGQVMEHQITWMFHPDHLVIPVEGGALCPDMVRHGEEEFVRLKRDGPWDLRDPHTKVWFDFEDQDGIQPKKLDSGAYQVTSTKDGLNGNVVVAKCDGAGMGACYLAWACFENYPTVVVFHNGQEVPVAEMQKGIEGNAPLFIVWKEKEDGKYDGVLVHRCLLPPGAYRSTDR